MNDQICLANKKSCLEYGKGGYCYNLGNCIHKAEANITPQEIIRSNASLYFNGAADFMKYAQNYYNGEPIFPSEMEDIFTKFLEQYGELR
jgi:hypothetical protein